MIESRPSRKKQSGFSIVGVVLIVVVLALVGLGGWYVWHTNQSKKTADTTKSQPTTAKTETTADASDGGKSLVIKEWNVRLLLPQKLQNDVYYEYSVADSKTVPNAKIETVKLKSKTLDKITSDCNGNKFYLQNLSRSTARLHEDEYPNVQTEMNFKEFDGYSYNMVGTANEVVATQQCAHPEDVSQAKDNFRTSIGGAQALHDSMLSISSIK